MNVVRMCTRFILVIGILGLLTSCADETETTPLGQHILESGDTLNVLTLEGPTTYRHDRDGPLGYEVDLVEAFAQAHGYEVRYMPKRGLSALLTALNNGEAHLAAAGLTRTDMRAQTIGFGPAYRNVTQQLVCRRGGVVPSSLNELSDVRLSILDGSSYLETVEGLKVDWPELGWTTRRAGSAMPLLTAVDRRQIDCTVADSNLVEYARRVHPELVVPFELTEDQPLAWAIAPGQDQLSHDLHDWFETAHESGLLHHLDERWYGHLDDFDYVDVAVFIQRLDDRLPQFQRYFQTAARDVPFEWELLAAQAYQESHWDPDAVSPTGVRGLMMLTRSTAQRMGIDNRLDPRQSVEGGAAYLAELYDRLPEDISGQDRLWFALAAYNIGLGHIYDVRALAEREGLNKSSWDDIETLLPQLTRPEVYTTLRHGYARGHEAQLYVQKVREYHQLLRANLEL